ncbi:MAG: carbohydrate ABC transporter permease [candidate division FCPU426 bacterium]
MGIISQVGRKSRSVKFLILSMYGLLILGVATILVPLMVMLTMSVSSVTDLKRFALLPRYVYSKQDLYVKYLAEKYREKLQYVRENYPIEGQDWLSWETVKPTLHAWSPEKQAGMDALAADWDVFLKDLPQQYFEAAYYNDWNLGAAQSDFHAFLGKRYKDADDFNKRTGMNVTYLSTVLLPADNPAAQVFFYPDVPLMRDYLEFKGTLPAEYRRPFSANSLWAAWLKFHYNDDLAALNKAWGTAYQDAFFVDIPFPLQAPSAGQQSKDYVEFMRSRFPRAWIRLKGGSTPAYVAFLKKTYLKVGDFNVAGDGTESSWAGVKLPETAPTRAEVKMWSDYVNTLPLSSWSAPTVESRYHDFLVQKYGSVESAEKKYGVTLSGNMGGVFLPARLADEHYFKENRGKILWHFLSSNYVSVSKFLFQQGRAVNNTVILVILSIVTALVVNPIAAFALSRFRISYTPKVLLFLLATAAFPAEVTAIPQFILIKKFGMLNTFWALVLPGLANGFWIFMLKGFFDSLPKELYEAAIIEGAGEFTLFTKVTVPLAAPILALTAFGAFNAAYSGYLWNIIVANDNRMWTLMVALQQYMGEDRPASLVMAAMALASIPTLIAFLMVQRVILRGIVIPGMH